MSHSSCSPPRDRRIRTERVSYRDAPYRREMRGGTRGVELYKNCKRPGHYARECPSARLCNNCSLPGHIAAKCTARALCWNCKEPAEHLASKFPNVGTCHTCGKSGHLARYCATHVPPGDTRLYNNCYKQGHLAADCTNEKAWCKFRSSLQHLQYTNAIICLL